ncbi:MAG: hypothetical protein AAFR44_07490, partial [Pseudomonadota bacterium]
DVAEPTLDDGRVEHFNGAVDGGSLDVPFKFIEGDAGQAILIAAEAGNTTYSFAEVNPDKTAITCYYGRLGAVREREASPTGFKGFVTQARVNSKRVRFAPTAGQFGTDP